MATKTIQVEGMSCEHCKSAVSGALNNLDGVSQADVDLEAGTVEVNYDDAKVDDAAMTEAIEDQGYDVK
ncbi:copper chaperone CopZ [Staphylococcus kloosii]|jgi:copper chaperone|uniref:Copper chaperone CopZ n=1 Tax=Staphylococcus kloosii TaxID=29384 RepID=A0ABQ0XK35_9STAP|nr:copper chaperone CopZ [Staphylococcus kloosii]AVQ35234.1 copper chaperone [Staphylococcus kloosii]MBF7021169.1 copper chaperone CopZ [Staphylococcus kloosii]PNZ05169.1 copper resistance protein CopZ [Staphylococcus kloosii]PTJ79982.1 copper chaperone [Staphylococcus kloosii]SUM48277.1 copper chaperone [Staphylococcus kloosii]